MTVGHVNVILAALGKLPHDEVNEMVVGIRRVALEQVQAAQQPKPEEQRPAASDSEGGDPA
jgi:hypothetical protein